MLKRSAEADLDAFLESDEKKCLVIRGARQVGKTYLVREAGRKRTGWSFIEVNFLEQPQLKDIFSGSLDIAALLLNFSVMLPSARFVPGKTLLLLDEIQECPEAGGCYFSEVLGGGRTLQSGCYGIDAGN